MLPIMKVPPQLPMLFPFRPQLLLVANGNVGADIQRRRAVHRYLLEQEPPVAPLLHMAIKAMNQQQHSILP